MRGSNEKVDQKEQMSNISIEMEILENNKKQMPGIKKKKLMHDSFEKLISRIGMAEKRIRKLADMSVKTFKAEKKRKKRLKNNRIFRTVEQLQKVYHME